MIAFDLRNSILIGNASETFHLEIFYLSNSRLKSQLMNRYSSKDAEDSEDSESIDVFSSILTLR